MIHPVRLAIATALFLAAGLGFAPAQSSSTSGGSVDPGLIEDLVAANRILAEEGVLDAYGHVSIRHPSNPNRYLMSRSLAPALVSASDIMEYDLDSNPIDPKDRRSVIERFIHGEIYKARPDVKSGDPQPFAGGDPVRHHASADAAGHSRGIFSVGWRAGVG